MQDLADRRRVWVALALVYVAYAAFVFSTRPNSFGLTLDPNGRPAWLTTRILTFSFWVGLAAVFVGVRRSPVAWRSFAYAFLATSVVAMAIAPSLVSAAANRASIAGTIVAYASASGFVCITLARPLHAVGLGALVFLTQLILDGAAHVFSGQVRLH
jgi:hypothetical protein